MAHNLPASATVVIIGGGVIGCSLAYHLTKRGLTDVVLLERKQLTCGTTWHAAGLVGQLRATQNMTMLAQYTTGLFKGLAQETGQETGFRQNGSISLATHAARFEELKRGASMAKAFNLEVQVITPLDIKALYPHISTHDVVGGVYLPNDGQTNPIDTTIAMAKGARVGGAKIFEGVTVTDILKSGRKVTGVVTDHGTINADMVVNAAGMWGRDIGKKVGVSVPLQACEHFYVVTEEIEGLPRNLPVLRDPDHCAYIKEDAGKWLIGAFEKEAKPWGMSGIPADFSFDELPEDWDHFMPVLESAMARLPDLANTGIRTFFNGPESFTPDDRYLLGPSAEIPNFFLACGFNSIGIQSSGGAGKVLADWMVDGHPPIDLWDVDCRRIQSFQSNQNYLVDRAKESLGLLYDMHWPFRQPATARNARLGPFHSELDDLGAVFGEVAGWERANWFARPGQERRYDYSYGRQNWFENCADEVKATREGLALYDLSSFGKFMVKGKDACSVLNHISCNDVDVDEGQMVYTQWLNERGGVEADLTVSRHADDLFSVVTGAAVTRRDLNWLERHIPEHAHCMAFDMTTSHAVLAVMGPKSRDLMERLSKADFTNQAFPFGTMQDIEIGYATISARRISYVGELGWELYIPVEFSRPVFALIWEEAKAMGGKMAGIHALDHCRLEKGFRHFGHDLSDEDHILSSGLGFTCKMYKNFIGRDAVQAKRDEGGLKKRLVQFMLNDPQPILYHDEPILRNGRIVGTVSSGNYSHTLGASIAMGYVSAQEVITQDWLDSGDWSIEVAHEAFSAKAQLQAWYDPKGVRMKL